ncbi:MAG TPA: hypothetical protein VEU33_22505, partial [Archangium sp.]|nr:hypothetical protein [Archangium sp.]
GLTRWLGERLTDTREESRITHSLRELVRTHLLLLAQGWRDQDDADALRSLKQVRRRRARGLRQRPGSSG